MEKCKEKPGGFADQLCVFLRGASTYSNGRKSQKGIIKSPMTNIKSGERTGTKVSVFNEDGRDLVLNLCPFCGGKLHDFEE